jgi:hypothetical protein
VLGPLLFLIYINDISNCTDSDCLNRLFADDASAFIAKRNAQELKDSMTRILKQLFEWFSANKLTVNLSKTCFIIFRSNSKKNPDFLSNLKIDDITINRVKSAKHLGVTLDENLNWHDHISEINSSLVKISNSFKIIQHQIPTKNKILFYNAYILSKIQYGIEVYGTAACSALKKVQTQQNRALKILYSKDFYTPTKLLHKELNILLVEDIYRLSVSKFVYKHQNDLLPSIFDKFFTQNTTIYSYNTRQSRGLYANHPKRKSGEKRIKYQGTILWNSIPEQTRYLSIKTFTKKVKQGFLCMY